MFIHKFSSKNLISSKLRNILSITKFSFARRVSNPNAKSSTQNLFNKFSLDTEEKQKQENHFSRRLKKELGDDRLEISEEEKTLLRKYEKEIASGKGQKGKNSIDEMLDSQTAPRMIQELENSGDSSELNPFLSHFNKEIEKIKKSKTVRESDNQPTDNSNLYTQSDLDMLIRNKKNRGVNQKENPINKGSLKLDDSKFSEHQEDEIEELNIEQKFKNLKEIEDKNREKDFFSLFDKTKLNQNKKKSKNSKSLDQEILENEGSLDFDKIRNLRKIKNSTNREYNHTEISKVEEDNIEILDSTIPDMNIIEKRSRNAEDEERFKDLMRSDIRPYEKNLEKKEAILHDAKKLSKITTVNNISIKNNRNEIFKRRALELAKLWQMPSPETKHWYYKLRREQKEIIKVINMRKKLEQKRKLKKIQKQWKIDNKENLDVNYADFLNKDSSDKQDLNENVKIPKHFKNINEFLFFGEDLEFLKHYKRTCKNIENALNEFFLKNKQSIMTGIARNADIHISEVKMNKACTVIYAWWDLPYISDQILNSNPDETDAINKSVQFKLNQAMPYIKSVLTRKIGLKYAPDIRFVRDEFDEEIQQFQNYIDEMRTEKLEINSNKDENKDTEIFMKLISSPNFLKQIKEEISKFKDEAFKRMYEQFFFDENQNVFQKFQLIKMNNPEVFNSFLKQFKSLVDFSKFKTSEKDDKNPTGESKTTMTKAEKRAKVRRDKTLKKMRLTEEDLKCQKNIDYSNSLYNFAQNYERKIPGQFTLGASFKDMEKKSDKSEFISETAQINFRKQIKKAVKESEELGKPKKTKREKSIEFWKNLQAGVI
jgi:hypothetical protein